MHWPSRTVYIVAIHMDDTITGKWEQSYTDLKKIFIHQENANIDSMDKLCRQTYKKQTPNLINKDAKHSFIDFKKNLQLATSTSGNKVLELQ
jgi:hypothetical protein